MYSNVVKFGFFIIENNSSAGLVFGIPLSQCVDNDRLSKSSSAGSTMRSDEPNFGRPCSRASFSSLIDAARDEEVSIINFKLKILDP